MTPQRTFFVCFVLLLCISFNIASVHAGLTATIRIQFQGSDIGFGYMDGSPLRMHTSSSITPEVFTFSGASGSGLSIQTSGGLYLNVIDLSSQEPNIFITWASSTLYSSPYTDASGFKWYGAAWKIVGNELQAWIPKGGVDTQVIWGKKTSGQTQLMAGSTSASTLTTNGWVTEVKYFTAVTGGSGGNDPIIGGFDGRQFDFKGTPNKVFNIFSMPDFQVSAKFIEANKPGMTYMGAIAVKQGGVSHVSFDLEGAYLHSNKSSREIVHKFAYGSEEFELPNGGVVTRPSIGTMKITWPQYSISMIRIYERPAGATEEFSYIDFSLNLAVAPKKDEVHGVLGQTYFRLNDNQLVRPVDGYYEGYWEDYASEDSPDAIFSDNFPKQYYKYNPSIHMLHIIVPPRVSSVFGSEL